MHCLQKTTRRALKMRLLITPEKCKQSLTISIKGLTKPKKLKKNLGNYWLRMFQTKIFFCKKCLYWHPKMQQSRLVPRPPLSLKELTELPTFKASPLFLKTLRKNWTHYQRTCSQKNKNKNLKIRTLDLRHA